MQKTSKIGADGEALAKSFLEEKGYEVIAMNWRHKRSEVDIIAKDKKVIVFVEVKTRNNTAYGHPEEFVNKNKIKKLREAADAFIEQTDWKGELRFDIIAIHKDSTQKFVIEHIEDAFFHF